MIKSPTTTKKEWRNVGPHGMSLINGASNVTSTPRAEHDFYATDPRALEALLRHEQFATRVWEPCCGAGHLSSVLRAHGHEVRESDIIDRIGNEVIDFLSFPPPFDGDIITNPPYAMAAECVEQALRCIPDGHKVAMFLKLTFLEGKARRALFRQYPPPTHLRLQRAPAMRTQRRLHPHQGLSRMLRLVHLAERLQWRAHRAMAMRGNWSVRSSGQQTTVNGLRGQQTTDN